MKFIVKKEDLGRFATCVSQIINEFGLICFAYEDDFKEVVNCGTTHFYISEDEDIGVAFENLKKQIPKSELPQNIFFFISTKIDNMKADTLDSFVEEIAETSNAKKMFWNIYDEEKSNKHKIFLFANK